MAYLLAIPGPEIILQIVSVAPIVHTEDLVVSHHKTQEGDESHYSIVIEG